MAVMMTAQPCDLTGAKYASLATSRRNGIEVKTPVWIAPMNGRHYVFSAGDAGKVKRIRSMPHVRLAVCDARGTVKSDWCDGNASIIVDPALITQVKRAFRDKYGIIMQLTDAMATLSGRIRRRAYIEIELVAPPF